MDDRKPTIMERIQAYCEVHPDYTPARIVRDLGLAPNQVENALSRLRAASRVRSSISREVIKRRNEEARRMHQMGMEDERIMRMLKITDKKYFRAILRGEH